MIKIKATKKPHQKNPENTLCACIICTSRTGHLLAVYPYLLRDGHRCVPSPSLLDTQALDSTWKSSGNYLLHIFAAHWNTNNPFSVPQETLKSIWRNKSAVQHLVINWRFPTPCWLKAYVSETCLCFADNFCTYAVASTFKTSMENVLPGTIQRWR